jgi:hypothetical protein
MTIQLDGPMAARRQVKQTEVAQMLKLLEPRLEKGE